LRADPSALHLRLRQAMETEATGRDALIVVDQFEEVFTLCVDEEERLAFVTGLMHVAAAPSSRARLVLGVRADFFGHCLQYPQLRQVLGEGPVLVGAMTADELRQAITKPAIDLGYTVETALVTRLVSEATNQPGVLPLMSHALLETWKRRQGIALTAAGYDAAGGISHALNRTAESVYSGLSEEQQDVARQVFLRLTALGDGTEDTRRRVDRAELDHVDGLDEVLDALVVARLVTVDRDSVDIAHEALISHWPRLREWLIEDRDSLRAHRQLTEAAEIWDGLNRDDGALYRGARLQLARDWVRSCTPSLSHRERAFFDRSVNVREQELLAVKRQTTRQRRFIALLMVLLVALSGTTAYSLISQQTIAQQRDDATIRNVIDQIPVVAADNQPLADDLALALYRYAPSERTRGLLLSTDANSTHNAIGRPDNSFDARNSLNAGATHYAYASDAAGTVGLDELSAGGVTMGPVQLPKPADIVGKVASATVATDGRHVAVVYEDRPIAETVALWDVTDIGHPKVVRTYKTDDEVDVVFSPDGRLLAIGSLDGLDVDHQPGDKTVVGSLGPQHAPVGRHEPGGRSAPRGAAGVGPGHAVLRRWQLAAHRAGDHAGRDPGRRDRRARRRGGEDLGREAGIARQAGEADRAGHPRGPCDHGAVRGRRADRRRPRRGLVQHSHAVAPRSDRRPGEDHRSDRWRRSVAAGVQPGRPPPCAGEPRRHRRGVGPRRHHAAGADRHHGEGRRRRAALHPRQPAGRRRRQRFRDDHGHGRRGRGQEGLRRGATRSHGAQPVEVGQLLSVHERAGALLSLALPLPGKPGRTMWPWGPGKLSVRDRDDERHEQ
jgi:hypothetical protein